MSDKQRVKTSKVIRFTDGEQEGLTVLRTLPVIVSDKAMGELSCHAPLYLLGWINKTQGTFIFLVMITPVRKKTRRGLE
jgi:hypothetical protein